MFDRKVLIRIVELLLCIACVVALRVTDDESRRVFHYLRNLSREWGLLNNVTWGVIGQAFATATCGGYIIITAGLLIAAATGELRGRKTEFFLLFLGAILFGILGGLTLASIDSIPQDLIDNASVLGVLCLLTALAFIADLLMSSPEGEKKNDGAQTYSGKNSVRPITTMTIEKETRIEKIDGRLEDLKDSQDSKGKVNNGFIKSDGSRLHENLEDIDYIDRPFRDQDVSRDDPGRHSLRLSDVLGEDQDRKSQDAERQNRDLEKPQKYLRNSDDSFENQLEGHRMRREDEFFRLKDIYQRPVDELDTPRFPMTVDKNELLFAEIVNPGVKILRVDRDVEESVQKQRHSDSSQYDNVPTRMFSSSNGILKKGRDTVFTVPRPSISYRHQEKSKDEIEMLEEYFTTFRATTTGTQTTNRLPFSPNDAGYVRHTASNWPQDPKSKTRGGNPERERIKQTYKIN